MGNEDVDLGFQLGAHVLAQWLQHKLALPQPPTIQRDPQLDGCADNINNWDYTGLVKAMDNRQWKSFTARVQTQLLASFSCCSESANFSAAVQIILALLTCRKPAVRTIRSFCCCCA